MPVSTLYICYFGLREPLVQTQVLPYLRELIKDGIEVTLLTFEPDLKNSWDESAANAARDELAAVGIDWHATGYHKRPSVPATAYDVLNGARIVRRLLNRKKFDVIHGRTLLGVLIGAIGRRSSRSKPKLIYDMRGFFAEEYTDAGIWPVNGSLYRTAKRVDRWGMEQADGFVVLTEKARSILFPGSEKTGFDGLGRPVEVIPCCIDSRRFETITEETRAAARDRLGAKGRHVIAYVGSFGGWYMTDEMIEFFKTARELEPETFILVLTQRDANAVRAKLVENGIGPDDMFVDSVSPENVPDYLSAADVAISFIKPCYSKQASSPTKIAEYLACGLPVISNTGIGDLDTQITEDGVGVLIDSFTPDTFETALQHIKALGDVRTRCIAAARSRFDLVEVGGKRYRRLYKRLLQS
jgi:glycosyltransferase involved in cell wall biosynthesis